MIEYKITADTTNVQILFDRLAMNNPKLRKRILSKILAKIKSKVIKEELKGQALNRITGELAKSIKYKAYGKQTKDGNEGYILSRMMWSGAHEYGLDKMTRNKKRLTIPKRPFLAPAVEQVFSSGEAERIGQTVTEKWIQEQQGNGV
jgi:phage gpG-like protein